MSDPTDNTEKKGFKLSKDDRKAITAGLKLHRQEVTDMPDHPKWDKRAEVANLDRLIEHFEK